MDDQPTIGDLQSRARTHLANDRTCLAWLRTAISLIAVGLASAHFLDDDPIPGFPVTTILAAILVLGGVALAVVGGRLFVRARTQIDQGTYLAESPGIPIAVAVVVVAGVGCFVMVILLSYRG